MRIGIAVGLMIGLLASPAGAQRVTATDVFNADGLTWHNGTGPTPWLRLRAIDVSVPPRTARTAGARAIQITEGGDPFGRLVLLWSGWEGNGGDRTEYWLKCLYKWQPIYEAAHLYDSFGCGNDTFRARLWNDQFTSWQARSVEVSLYVANAPLPFLASFQPPSWTSLAALDRNPQRAGVQVDPQLDGAAVVNYFTGAATVRREQVGGLQRAAGKNFYIAETRPSPFRDRATMQATATLKVNNAAPQTLWTRSYAAEWAPLDGNTDRALGNETLSHTLQFSSYPVGTVLTLAYQAQIDRLPFNKSDQPMPPPQREPIEDLRDGQNLNFDLRGLTYSYSGALSGGGSVSDADAPPVCVPKSAGTLNITLNLRNFIRDLPTDLIVTLAGTRVDATTVRWTFDITPNQCVSLGSANALVKRVWGQLLAQIEVIPLFLDDRCNRYYNLRLTPVGGDAGNWINAELYAFCFENAATRVNVAVRNINYTAYAGGVFESTDPRVLYQFLQSQVIELIRYGDTTGDGCVDDADLLLVLFNFGATGANPADVNGNGIVDDADLLDVLFNFGRGC